MPDSAYASAIVARPSAPPLAAGHLQAPLSPGRGIGRALRWAVLAIGFSLIGSPAHAQLQQNDITGVQIVGEIPLSQAEASALIAALQAAPDAFVLTDVNGENPISVAVSMVSLADLDAGALDTLLDAQTIADLEDALAQGLNVTAAIATEGEARSIMVWAETTSATPETLVLTTEGVFLSSWFDELLEDYFESDPAPSDPPADPPSDP